ncbi:MAG: Mrp/NBP35 family ATP-binding protein [Planctomycetota bacterium]
MSSAIESRVLLVLEAVKDPDMGSSIVSMGMIKDIVFDGGAMSLTCELTTPACPVKAQIEKDIRDTIGAQMPEVTSLVVNMSAKVRGSHMPSNTDAVNLLPQIKHVIAVGAGKGGVGKSTCALNLALALQKLGAKAALLDCDLYGPSIPIMTGLKEKPKLAGESKIYPMIAHGMEVMSMGLLVEFNQAMIWRGPILDGIVVQFLRDVIWSAADYLVIDLPPGTGDVALSLAQTCPLTGAVLVTTPQRVAIADVVRARTMFKQVKVPVLGMIENMSGYTDPATGKRLDLFSKGGGETAAEQMGIPFLGSIPLDPEISLSGDCGVPILISHPDSEASKAFMNAAAKLAAQISINALTGPVEGAGDMAHSFI